MHRRGLIILCLTAALFTACEPSPAPTPAPSPTPTPSPSPSPSPTSSSVKVEYEDIEVGTGPRPLFNQKVRVRYTGWYTDGTKFDSNEDRMSSALEFRLGKGEVIPGWEIGIGGGQGIPPMRVGGRRKLTIPPKFAYGEFGRGAIPPNATLIFEVSLVGIE